MIHTSILYFFLSLICSHTPVSLNNNNGITGTIDFSNIHQKINNEKQKSLINFQINLSDDLVGSWSVDEIHYLYKDTTYKQIGIHYGRFLFTKNRYAVMYNPRLEKRKSFKNLSNPTPQEIIEGFKSVVFNSGSWQINKDQIITQANIAKVPGFEGGKQYYKYILTDNILEMILYDETYPNGKKPDWYQKVKVKFRMIKEH